MLLEYRKHHHNSLSLNKLDYDHYQNPTSWPQNYPSFQESSHSWVLRQSQKLPSRISSPNIYIPTYYYLAIYSFHSNQDPCRWFYPATNLRLSSSCHLLWPRRLCLLWLNNYH